MATQSVTCPQCKLALRSQRELSPTEMLRCPQCGNHFLSTAGLTNSPVPTLVSVSQPIAPTPSGNGIRAFALLMIPAAFVAGILGLGTVLGVYLLVRPQPLAPVVDQEREHRLAEQEKKLAEERNQFDEEKRRQQFNKLMDEGKKQLDDKKFNEALTTIEAALKIYPNDPDALNALIAAKTGKAVAKVDAQLTENKEKRKADFDKLMEQGKQAMKDKQFAVAGNLFERAMKLMPGEVTASKALTEATTELAKDESEKKKLADYKAFLDAGKAATAAGRYADAIREFISAQRILPGDTVAIQGQKDAEKQLAALKDTDKNKAEYNRLMDKAKTALREKKYVAAIDNATAALVIEPNDLAATDLTNEAKKARASAGDEVKRLLLAAQTARVAQRFEEAQRLYTKALELLPDDPIVVKAQKDFQGQLGDLQAGQAAYNRFMTVGTQALAANRYADAVQAYSEALRLVPNDLDAQKGLAAAQQVLNLQVNVKATYDGFMTVGAAAMNKKLYRDAEVAYRDALKTIPDDPLAIAGLRQAKYLHGMTDGDRALLLKKYPEAVKFFKEALEANPGDLTAIEQLKVARYQHGIQDGTAALSAKKYADAVVLFEEALREKPNDRNIKELLHQAKYSRALTDGQNAMKFQKFDEAIGFFQEALKEKPNDITASKALEQARRLRK